MNLMKIVPSKWTICSHFSYVCWKLWCPTVVVNQRPSNHIFVTSFLNIFSWNKWAWGWFLQSREVVKYWNMDYRIVGLFKGFVVNSKKPLRTDTQPFHKTHIFDILSGWVVATLLSRCLLHTQSSIEVTGMGKAGFRTGPCHEQTERKKLRLICIAGIKPDDIPVEAWRRLVVKTGRHNGLPVWS